MKQIRIKSLKLENFKGQNKSVEFTSDNVEINGDNCVGKTSLMKAFFWLLSGQTDAHNVANHELFDNTQEMNESAPIASVEAKMQIGDYEYTIKRTAKSKFERVRGEDTIVKAKSDEYKLYIDDIEISSTKFKEFISSNICDYDNIVYVLSGEFFANLSIDKKNEAIKLVQNIVGEVNQSDLQGNYTLLFKMLERFPIEQLEEQTNNRMKPIREKIGDGNSKGEIDIRIETKQETLSQLKQIDYDTIKSHIDDKSNEIDKIDKQIMGASEQIKPQVEARNKYFLAISDLQNKISKYRNEFEDKQNAPVIELEKQIANVESTNREINAQNDKEVSAHNGYAQERDRLARRIESQTERLNALREEMKQEKAKVFGDTKCTYCGQELPIDKIDELSMKFNLQKAKNLDAIKTKGKLEKSEIESLQAQLDEVSKKAEKGYELKPLINVSDLKNTLEKVNQSKLSIDDDETYKIMREEIINLNNSIPSIENFDTFELSLKKDVLMRELSDLNKQYGGMSTIKTLEEEIEELKIEKKNNGVELAKLEGLKEQIKEYKDEIAKVASNKINELLDYCKIETKVKLKSGEWKDACDIQLKNGIKYSTANNGSRILVQIDLQRMFCKYYGITMPIWIDEASILNPKLRPSFEGWQCISIVRTDDNKVIVNNK